MRKVINGFEGIMISKILSCKTPFGVLAIIDKKVKMIEKRTTDKAILRHFIDSSLFDLSKIKEKDAAPNELSKIHAAISHLQNLEQHYKSV